MSTQFLLLSNISYKISGLYVLSSNTQFCLKGGTAEASLIDETCQ